jgi:transaldolase
VTTGQRLWLDNLTRDHLRRGTLARYIAEGLVTGLTSNPTIFEQAIRASAAYDASIQALEAAGKSGEDLLFDLVLEDLTAAADLFRPLFEASGGADGWVSLEVSPQLADDAPGTIVAATRLWAQASRANLFIKVPGTDEGVHAIEALIVEGVPVNVTLLFSREQYLGAAHAYLRALERRVATGFDPGIASVASIFVSRWDTAVKDAVPATLRNRLGIATAMQVYAAHRDLYSSERWLRLAAVGARPQRLLWASTGTKDPEAPDTLYVDALASKDTISTLPEKTLLAFADHGHAAPVLPSDGGDSEAVLGEFQREGVDDEALAARLQREGVAAFAASWWALLARIEAKRVERVSA